MTRWPRLLLLLLLPLLLSGAGLQAQTIEGYLLDASTGGPILLGEVFLLTGGGVVADRTFTDEEGYFAVYSPEAGPYFLRAEHMAYQSRVDGIFDLGEGGVLSVEFRLLPDPMAMDTLAVEVERREIKLSLLGFYDRRDRGMGYFLGPEEIERRVAMDATDLFRNIPRVRINWVPFGGSTITVAGPSTRSLRGQACYPRVLVDGMEMFRGGRERARINEVVSPSEIRGIEIYRGSAETPLQFGGSAGACGVILIWTG